LTNLELGNRNWELKIGIVMFDVGSWMIMGTRYLIPDIGEFVGLKPGSCFGMHISALKRGDSHIHDQNG
jgi:hypothetical protein